MQSYILEKNDDVSSRVAVWQNLGRGGQVYTYLYNKVQPTIDRKVSELQELIPEALRFCSWTNEWNSSWKILYWTDWRTNMIFWWHYIIETRDGVFQMPIPYLLVDHMGFCQPCISKRKSPVISNRIAYAILCIVQKNQSVKSLKSD